MMEDLMYNSNLNSNHAFCVGLGLALGAGIMYLADPKLGRRRRAMFRSRASGLKNDVCDYLGKSAKDLENRVEGAIHETKSTVTGNA